MEYVPIMGPATGEGHRSSLGEAPGDIKHGYRERSKERVSQQRKEERMEGSELEVRERRQD